MSALNRILHKASFSLIFYILTQIHIYHCLLPMEMRARGQLRFDA